jgi:hypothetical protein
MENRILEVRCVMSQKNRIPGREQGKHNCSESDTSLVVSRTGKRLIAEYSG